jgi:predicted MFS family arabinose efflux permease
VSRLKRQSSQPAPRRIPGLWHVRLEEAVIIALAALQSGSIYLVSPILPIFLHAARITYSRIGVTIALYYLVSLLLQPFVAPAIRRFSERPVLVAAFALSAAGAVALSASSDFAVFLLARGAQGGAYGAVMVALNSYVGRHMGPDRRPRAYSLLTGTIVAGSAAAPLLSTTFGLTHPRQVFAAAAAIALTGALTGSLLPAKQALAGEAAEKSHPGQALLVLPLAAGVIFFAGVGALNGMYEVSWSPLMLHKGASSVEIGLSWTTFALPYLFIAVAGHRVISAVSRPVAIAVSGAVAGAFAVVYPHLPSPPYLICAAVLEALGSAFAVPAMNDFLASVAGKSLLPTIQTASVASQFLAQAVFATLAGLLLEGSFASPFTAAGAAAIAASLAAGAICSSVLASSFGAGRAPHRRDDPADDASRGPADGPALGAV